MLEHHDHALSHPPPTHCSPPPLHGRRNWLAASLGRNNGNSVLFDLTGVVSPPDTSNSTAEYSELASALDLDPVMRHIPELGGSLSGGSGNNFEGSIIEPNVSGYKLLSHFQTITDAKLTHRLEASTTVNTCQWKMSGPMALTSSKAPAPF